jgi:phage tail-like protein
MEQARIARFLPETYRAAIIKGSPLHAILAVMEALHRPSEDVLARLDEYIDPLRAPEDFAFMLASWLDLERYFDWTGGRKGAGRARFAAGLGRLRALSATAVHLLRWRGTKYALERFLFVATGIAGFTVEENPPDAGGAPRPFHIVVHAPAAAQRFADLVGRIVDEERPVYVTYDIAFAPPPAEPSGGT